MTPQPNHIVGCGIAVIRGGKILLSRRLDPAKPGHGRWAMPGGKIEDGEWPAKAVERELREETSLNPVDVAPLPHWHWTDKWTSDGTPWLTLYFHATAWGEPRNTEPHKHSDWQWFAPRELPEPLWDGIHGCLVSLGLL